MKWQNYSIVDVILSIKEDDKGLKGVRLFFYSLFILPFMWKKKRIKLKGFGVSKKFGFSYKKGPEVILLP